MNEFVDECRREWRRLGVPDPVANEMAADLTADLEEAEAEGGSPEDVLGNSAFDPRRFAAAWAARPRCDERPRPGPSASVAATCRDRRGGPLGRAHPWRQPRSAGRSQQQLHCLRHTPDRGGPGPDPSPCARPEATSSSPVRWAARSSGRAARTCRSFPSPCWCSSSASWASGSSPSGTGRLGSATEIADRAPVEHRGGIAASAKSGAPSRAARRALPRHGGGGGVSGGVSLAPGGIPSGKLKNMIWFAKATRPRCGSHNSISTDA